MKSKLDPRRRYVWGGGTMLYLINEGYDSERTVDADYYDYRADTSS